MLPEHFGSKTHHPELAGNGNIAGLEFLDHPECREILHRENCIGGIWSVQQIGGCCPPGINRYRSAPYQFFLNRKPMVFQGGLVSSQAVAENLDMLLPGDMGDPAVALPDQVVGCKPSSPEIIDDYGRDSQAIMGPVEKYEGNAPFRGFGEMRIIHGLLRDGGDDAVHPGAEEGLDAPDFVFPLLIRLIDQHIVSLAVGDVLNSVDHGTEEIDLRAGNDDPDHMAFPGTEGGCDPVMVVIQLLSREPDIPFGAFADARVVVQRPGNSCRSGVQRPGNVGYGGLVVRQVKDLVPWNRFRSGPAIRAAGETYLRASSYRLVTSLQLSTLQKALTYSARRF